MAKPKTLDMTNMMKVYQIALKEIGQKEIPGSKENPRITEYHQATTLKSRTENTSWCAAFVSWCLLEAGLPSIKSAWARDWQKYGKALKKPVLGCLVGLERNGPGGDSHVCFFIEEKNGIWYCLGGNQSDMVKISAFNPRGVIYLRSY